jgi:hypothetical protein
MLEASAVVAAEMRRVDHLNRQFVRDRQPEETSRKIQHLTDEVVFDTVADEIKEADVMRCRAQVLQK